MKIAVWYHCKLSGEGIPNSEFALTIMATQMMALQASGLAEAAAEIHIGVNGSDGDALLASALAPAKSQLHVNGPHARTEISTMNRIPGWLPSHSDWMVLYHHIKGVTHPGQASYAVWRQRMENACVWKWRQCVSDLANGFEAVGCHWLTPKRYPKAVTSPFFGGTFWWATAKYLSQLPQLPQPTWENRFEAESWIGRRRPYPQIRDYFPGWP